MPDSTPETLRLASGSPRRAAVLRQLGIPFEVLAPDIDETPHPGEPPDELAERLARGKAAAGAAPGVLSFGFDTVVAHGGQTLGKPRSPEEAVEMVLRLSGDEHVVFSGIAAASEGVVHSAIEATRVRFREVGRTEAEAYVATGEPLDKAGAYGIQGAGASLVEWIEGDFFNVMGFPIQRFLDLLKAFGVAYDFRGLAAIEEET